MIWYQLQLISCNSTDVEQINEALENSKALSITLTDAQNNPILEPTPGTTPLWIAVSITALYDNKSDWQQTLNSMKEQFPHYQWQTQLMADQDWERAWMADFKPQQFGSRLWVCPSWSAPPDDLKAITIMLDPGLAFGTGNHATTNLCLTWLEQANLFGKTIVDYGCGSGILALAALKLGASFTYAVDIDPQALQATQSNLLKNHCSAEQFSIGLPNTIQNIKADLVIANILLQPLVAHKHALCNIIHQDNGILVVSGLLHEQEKILLEAYQDLFQLIETKQLEGWSLLVLRPILSC